MKKILAVAGLVLMLHGNDAFAETTVGANNSGAVAGTEATAASGTSSITQTFEASPQQAYMPGTVTAPVVSPTLFSVLGKPAQIAGLPVLSQYFFSTAVHKVGKGESGSTKVIYNAAELSRKPDSKNRKILFDFNGVAKGRVVGSLTVQSLKNSGDEVDLPTIIYDATHYVGCLSELQGYDVLLLSYPDLISFGIGVDAKSRGVSVSPVISGLINGPLGALTGVATGLSASGGVTVPTAIVGCTFLIVLQDKESPIDLVRCFGKSVPGVQVPEIKENRDGKEKPNGNGNGNGNGTVIRKKEYKATHE
ncbi:MAG: hypothetical protein HGB02_00220 [Chlorobiaceae bacterium]|nr:hypothetical protein [Chlorobiaceae bacterium]